MSRSHSVPPLSSDAQRAKSSFASASAILNQTTAGAPPHKFTAEANDVRRIALDLVTALEEGAALSKIDELAITLGAKCLDVQHRTLRARARGSR